jgi:hypothetical protein
MAENSHIVGTALPISSEETSRRLQELTEPRRADDLCKRGMMAATIM